MSTHNSHGAASPPTQQEVPLMHAFNFGEKLTVQPDDRLYLPVPEVPRPSCLPPTYDPKLRRTFHQRPLESKLPTMEVKYRPPGPDNEVPKSWLGGAVKRRVPEVCMRMGQGVVWVMRDGVVHEELVPRKGDTGGAAAGEADFSEGEEADAKRS